MGGFGGDGWLGGAEDPVLGGQRHRPGGQLAALPQRDVHRPVAPAGLAELPRAIQRVHDPHPVRRQPGRVVPALLGQHGVAGTAGREFAGEELMGTRVAGLAQVVRVAAA